MTTPIAGTRVRLDSVVAPMRLRAAKRFRHAILPARLAARHALRSVIPIRTRPHGLKLPLIVSLTSFPPRYPTLIHTLRALLLQDMKADAIELWLAEADASALPRGVLDLRAHGLSIRTTEDTRSFKKYVPARIAHPDAIIVTADDDLYFRPTWLSELVTAWNAYEQTIICHRAHRMLLDASGHPLPYGQWQHNVDASGPDISVFPTSGAGVLYAPGAHHADVIDAARFMTLSPDADDVWLYWMGLLAGSRFKKVGPKRGLVIWPGSQEQALWRVNEVHHTNDRAIAAMIAAYGLPSEISSALAKGP